MAYAPIVGRRDFDKALQRLRQVLKIDVDRHHTHAEHMFRARYDEYPHAAEGPKKAVTLSSTESGTRCQIAVRSEEDGEPWELAGLFVEGPDGKTYLTHSGLFGPPGVTIDAFREHTGADNWIDVDVERGRPERFLVAQIDDDVSEIDILTDIASFVAKRASLTANTEEHADTATRKEADPTSPTEKSTAALNRILYGPPGTGKTFDAVSLAVKIIDGRLPDDRKLVKAHFDKLRKAKQIEFVTFHQNYTYEDFIEGIRPVLKQDELAYELRGGIFKKISKRAKKHPEARYVLIIDEINRGNIAKIFGELITLVEPSKRLGGEDEARARLPYSQKLFGVPSNLYLIGTMNTADRGILLLDAALRRRFKFDVRMPDPSHLAEDIEGVNGQRLLTVINERIAENLDRDHQIGHTYLMKVKTLDELAEVFQTQIVPLLQEYFYDDWQKLYDVLNRNAFVTKREGTDAPVFDVLPHGDKWGQAESYQAIYGGNRGSTDDE